MNVPDVALPDANQSQPGKTPLRPLDIVSRGWSWLFLLVLLIFFSITGQGFLNIYNFQTIGADMSLVLIMALGQTFVIISGGIDLSTGFVMGMASVAAALVMSGLGSSVPLPVVVLAGAAAGLGIGLIPGLINGVVIARLRVPSFIVTLGMWHSTRCGLYSLRWTTRQYTDEWHRPDRQCVPAVPAARWTCELLPPAL